MLGKRSRQPIKRTTSMTGITVDVSDAEDVVDHHHQDPIISHLPPPQIHPMHESPDGNSRYDHRFLAMVSPRNPASFTNRIVDSSTTDTASFLRACWLCNRRLAPGRDIYMYRYSSPFIQFHLFSFKFYWKFRSYILRLNLKLYEQEKKEKKIIFLFLSIQTTFKPPLELRLCFLPFFKKFILIYGI